MEYDQSRIFERLRYGVRLSGLPWAWNQCVPQAWQANLLSAGCASLQIHTCNSFTYRLVHFLYILSYKGIQGKISYQRTMSASSSDRFCLTQVANPSPTRGFWLGNSPPGYFSSRAYGVTQRLCFKKAALLKNFASEPANGKQFEPGTSL